VDWELAEDLAKFITDCNQDDEQVGIGYPWPRVTHGQVHLWLISKFLLTNVPRLEKNINSDNYVFFIKARNKEFLPTNYNRLSKISESR
jgi:hypothetical protein